MLLCEDIVIQRGTGVFIRSRMGGFWRGTGGNDEHGGLRCWNCAEVDRGGGDRIVWGSAGREIEGGRGIKCYATPGTGSLFCDLALRLRCGLPWA